MKEKFVNHGTFVIEKTYPASREQVYKAMADAEAKARWFTKPEVFEFRVGGREFSSGEAPDGGLFTFDATYQEIVPLERIVYTYVLDFNSVRFSVSITTIELADTDGGTKLTFTEQGTFFDGLDAVENREHGSRELLELLGNSLAVQSEEAVSAEDDADLVPGELEFAHARWYDFPKEEVYRAWAQPELLTQWWGPNGFTSTFSEFDFREGGVWRFTFHGPDGKDYPNENKFIEIEPGQRIVLEHQDVHHGFRLTATFNEKGGRTRVTFRQQFKDEKEFEQVKSFCPECNEQNLDRLQAVLEGQRV
ncbi:SRPBCC family protein [Paenibacillus sp. GCM10027627]|uniref:SRPBCC family protein n=1 Tax=unclassified Paenibacillus TaxID=185978 RepID=UPI00363FA26E